MVWNISGCVILKAPPAKPMPEVSSVVSKLDMERTQLENVFAISVSLLCYQHPRLMPGVDAQIRKSIRSHFTRREGKDYCNGGPYHVTPILCYPYIKYMAAQAALLGTGRLADQR